GPLYRRRSGKHHNSVPLLSCPHANPADQCGMLVESVKMRNLLNYTVADAIGHAQPPARTRDIERGNSNHGNNQHHNNNNHNSNNTEEELREPDTYAFSANPIPALVIFLLGIMMSSHTQQSMISSMVHKQ